MERESRWCLGVGTRDGMMGLQGAGPLEGRGVKRGLEPRKGK